jgi:nucleoside-diphosphate-sugar epimerase
VRLPGILARPGGGPGLKSAFMSELFHGAVARRRVQLPVSANATLWVMSAACAADNLIHAAEMRIPADAAPALTLPVLRVTLGELVAAVVRRTGVDPGLFSFKPDAALEAQFGSLPPMTARAGSRLGFKHDGSLDRLVDRALCAAGYAGFEDATAP